MIELTTQYIPDDILHRKEQSTTLLNVFKNFDERGMASNLILLGTTGSGKTALINNILKNKNNAISGSAAIHKTTFKVLKGMFDIKCNTEGSLISKVIENLKLKPRVVVIDEINKLSDPMNLFNNLNTIYRETNCPIILITNKRETLYTIPEDAKRTLFFERIEFPPYNAIELYDIIKQRVDRIRNYAIDFPEEQLRKICAIVSKDSSARTLLMITHRCAMANDFSDKYINKVLSDLREDDWREFIVTLRPSHKDFLNILLDLQTCGKEIKPAEIIELMKDFTPSRISQLITYFEENGVIKTEYKNKGRAGGRTRIIKFASQEIFHDLDELMMEVHPTHKRLCL